MGGGGGAPWLRFCSSSRQGLLLAEPSDKELWEV